MLSASLNAATSSSASDSEEAGEPSVLMATSVTIDHEQHPSLDGANDLLDGTVLARIVGRDFDFTMPQHQRRMIIGRQSNLADVDVKIGMSTFVSRKHLEIFRVDDKRSDECGNVRFFLQCKGKNGIFVNGTFQRKGADPVELPKT
jgi:hypothetical protein